MPNPSDAQAFLFGVHRATKVVQRDRVLKEWQNAGFQLDLLSRIAQVTKKNASDKKRKMILLGAEWVLGSGFKLLDKKETSEFESVIAKSIIESSKRGADFPTQRWLPASPLLMWRRFRHVWVAALYSLPGTFIVRSAYRFYVSIGIRTFIRSRLGL